MKRRNADSTKFRKQFHFRKCKFAEGVYGSSTFLYLKFFFIWLLIMIADFLLEFRFEFLWPFWLVIRSLHDSFKYQGIIFSLFFALITFFSDLLCYMFLPVQWLFFAASTYVWVQYVWHTEKGICLPTISLWLLFVYIEASLRLKTLKTIDLCRPFAAHCIGYPMVTLGFGFKSYLSYKLRLKKQKEIQKLNEFYMQLIAKALPLELQLKDKEKFKALNYEEEISSQQVLSVPSNNTNNQTSQSSSILANICNIGSNNTNNTNTSQQNQNNINNNTNTAAFINNNKENNHSNKKSNNGILASALSFYLNGTNSTNNNTNTNSNTSSRQISNNNTAPQIEDLPYIQQKDISNIINKTINLNNNKHEFNSNYNAKQQQQQQQTFNKSNSFSNYNNSQNFSKKQQQHQNQSQPQLDNNSQSVNCNLSSFSIASVAYSTDQSNTNNSNSNLLVLNQKLDGTGSNGTENTNANSNHRSASSSTTSSTNTTFLPSNSSNHTNININMTINATAIAAATATATANAPNSTNNNINNNNNSNNQTALAKITSSNGKKFKNKDTSSQRANSVSSSGSSNSSNIVNGQQQTSNNSGSQSTLNNDYGYKDEMINKLEEDLKKLKLEIQQQKSVEQYLREQINCITKCDRTEKLKLERLQQENKTLQTKLNKSSTQSQKDKDEIDSLEKKLQDEKQLRSNLETQLNQEKKLKEEFQSKFKQQSQSISECSVDYYKNKMRDMENENKKLAEENKLKQERIMMLECEIKGLAKYRDNESRVDTLMVALNLMEDKNTSLQESLSAETRFKLDLFSALGETRRQLEAVNFQLKAKERELLALKTILKQSLTNGTQTPSPPPSSTTTSATNTNSSNDALSFNLNDVISQLNSASLMNIMPTNGLNSASSNDLYSFVASQPPQAAPSPTSTQSSTNYLPKI